MSTLLGPLVSLTSTTGAPFAPLTGAAACLGIYSPILLTCLVILARMLSKVFLICEGNYLVSKMSHILTAS